MDTFVLAGTMLPVIGILMTAAAASLGPASARGPVLYVLPAVVAAACWLAVPVVWKDGNLLAAVLYLVYWSALVVYYPVLVVRSLTAGRRRPRPCGPTPSPNARRAAGSSAP